MYNPQEPERIPDILTFKNDQGELCSVPNLRPAKAHKYVKRLPACSDAKTHIQVGEPEGKVMSEKEFLQYLKTIENK